MEPGVNGVPVTRQPMAGVGNRFALGDGLDLLTRLNLMVIHQKVDGIPLNVTPPSSARSERSMARFNRYTVMNGNGDKVYVAAETESEEMNCYGVPERPFEITVVDPRQRVVLKMERPCSAALFCSSSWCCCCWCGRLGGKLNVTSPDGTYFGKIVHSFRCCYTPQYNVYTNQKRPSLRIRGRCCSDCCCCASELFRIRSANGREVGTIAHNVKDEDIKALLKDAESLTVRMDEDLDTSQKALIMASTVLIDYMYYDGKMRGFDRAQTKNIRPKIYPAVTKE